MSILGQFAEALAGGRIDVVDLTAPLSRRRLSRYDDAGPAWAWDVLELGEHTGTHFDAPIHWISGKDGKDVASVEAERLVGPAVVVDRSAECAENPGYLLTVADLEAFEALDAARDRGIATVKIAVRSAESPVVLLDRADLVVDGPAGVVELLRQLA